MMPTSSALGQVHENLIALRDDFQLYPESVLLIGSTSIMARGDIAQRVIKFFVAYASFELYGNRNETLSVDPVADGRIDYSESAQFAISSRPGVPEEPVEDPRRHDFDEAVRSAKLLLPTALEAGPLPVNREIAQMVLNHFTPVNRQL